MVTIKPSGVQYKKDVMKQFGKSTGLRFKKEYLYFLEKYNGGTPELNMVELKDDKIKFITIISFFGVGVGGNNDIIEQCHRFKKWLPQGCLPIARVDGGNLICMSLGSESNGHIFMSNRDFMNNRDTTLQNLVLAEKYYAKMDNLHLVANSFTEFLSKMKYYNPVNLAMISSKNKEEWQQSEEFIGLICEELSNYQWVFCEFGSIDNVVFGEKNYQNNNVLTTIPTPKLYLLLVDSLYILIDKNFKIYRGFIRELRFNTHSWHTEDDHYFDLTEAIRVNLSHVEYKFMQLYIDNLKSLENNILEYLDNIKGNIIVNSESSVLLTSMLDLYFKENFKDASLFYVYEDDLLSLILSRKKNLTLSITVSFSSKLEIKFDMIIELLVKRKLLDDNILKELAYLILIRALREVAIDFYAKEFNESFGGYFPQIANMSLEESIIAYYKIDFMDKEDYGNIGWFTYYLFKYSDQINNIYRQSIMDTYEDIKKGIDAFSKNKELLLFEKELLTNKEKKKHVPEKITIDYVDFMSGEEFEYFIYNLFKKMGYSANLTPNTRDQGIDIIAAKGGDKIGVQVKCYSNAVTNKAVQEVVAGLKYYQLSKAVVITNNYFTKSAIDLARSNNVVLWDRTMIKEKLLEYYS